MEIGKVVILAGGFGSRLAEETEVRPKPLVEIGGRPILWHIMKIYSKFGLRDFVICLGYKGYLIKEYFANYDLHMSDVTFDLANGTTIVHHSRVEPWRVTLIDTGESTMTGGRIRRVREHIGDKTFCLTYGDGVAERIRQAAAKLDAFIDTHGADYVHLALELGVEPSRIDTIANFEAVKRYGVKGDGNAAGASAAVLAELAGLIASGQLELPVAGVYPLAQVQDAYRRLGQGHIRGKIVLVP